MPSTCEPFVACLLQDAALDSFAVAELQVVDQRGRHVYILRGGRPLVLDAGLVAEGVWLAVLAHADEAEAAIWGQLSAAFGPGQRLLDFGDGLSFVFGGLAD